MIKRPEIKCPLDKQLVYANGQRQELAEMFNR